MLPTPLNLLRGEASLPDLHGAGVVQAHVHDAVLVALDDGQLMRRHFDLGHRLPLVGEHASVSVHEHPPRQSERVLKGDAQLATCPLTGDVTSVLITAD
eukprot:442060-Pyramimonas_sp.AAC.1